MQLKLEGAKKDKERWKRTQSSPAYTRASPATRAKLDGIGSEYRQKLALVKAELESAIAEVVELPEFSSSKPRPRLNMGLVKTKILSYTAELKEWIEDAPRHVRKESPPDQLTTGAVDPEPPSPDTHPWTWDRVKAAITDLEGRVDVAAELLYSRTFTHFLDLEGRTEELSKERATRLKAPNRADEQPTRLAGKADEVGNELGARVELAAQLFEKISQNEQTIMELKTKREENMRLKAQVCSSIGAYPAWKLTSI